MRLGEELCPHCLDTVGAEEVTVHGMCCDCAEELIVETHGTNRNNVANYKLQLAELNKKLAAAKVLLEIVTDAWEAGPYVQDREGVYHGGIKAAFLIEGWYLKAKEACYD